MRRELEQQHIVAAVKIYALSLIVILVVILGLVIFGNGQLQRKVLICSILIAACMNYGLLYVSARKSTKRIKDVFGGGIWLWVGLLYLMLSLYLGLNDDWFLSFLMAVTFISNPVFVDVLIIFPVLSILS